MKSAARTLFATTAVALSLGLTIHDSAACTITGKINQTYASATGVNDFGYIYLYPETAGLPTAIYFAYIATDDDRAADMLSAAHAANHTVTLSTPSAVLCPTVGTFRYMGVLETAQVYSGQ